MGCCNAGCTWKTLAFMGDDGKHQGLPIWGPEHMLLLYREHLGTLDPGPLCTFCLSAGSEGQLPSLGHFGSNNIPTGFLPLVSYLIEVLIFMAIFTIFVKQIIIQTHDQENDFFKTYLKNEHAFTRVYLTISIFLLSSEIAKTEFLLREYVKYGFFLLKLSPKQWQIQQAMKRVSRSKENVNVMLPSIITSKSHIQLSTYPNSKIFCFSVCY